MIIVVIIPILAALSWYSAHRCIIKKNIYRNCASKMSGQVVYWRKYKDYNSRNKETFYYIDVVAGKGEIYHLASSSMKARKYKTKRDIVILVPYILQKSEEFTIVSQLFEKEKSNTLNESEREQLKKLRQTEEKREQINNNGDQNSETLIKIEEEVESGVELWLSVFMGVILTLLTIVVIVFLINCSRE